jgi:hypothetical protein
MAELYGDGNLWPDVPINHDVDDALERLDRVKERRQKSAAARLERATAAFGRAWAQFLAGVTSNTCTCMAANDCGLQLEKHTVPFAVALDSNQSLLSIDMSGRCAPSA